MENKRKILLQITRIEDENLEFVTNSLTHLEMRALISHMESLVIYFKKELSIDNNETEFEEDN